MDQAREEIESRIKQLEENYKQRAEQVIASDAVCAEIKGNITALKWAVGEENNDTLS
tara:strand:- start:12098 stop:12268 length:171 start_codon:yes stop_codon:yes gene_type:complete